MIGTASQARSLDDFNPALALGTADEFVSKPLPVHCRPKRKREQL